MNKFVFKEQNETDKYTKSFKYTQKEEYKHFFNEYGFVVIDNILTKDQCSDSIDDMWNYIEKFTKTVDRNDILTWKNKNWLGGQNEGLLGSKPVFSSVALLNRQNNQLYEIAKELMEESNILINQDRYGMFRATKNISVINDNDEEVLMDFPYYKTVNNLQLDFNPWKFIEKEFTSECKNILKEFTYENTLNFIEDFCYVGSIYNDIQKQSLDEFTTDDLLKVSKRNLLGIFNLADNLENDGCLQLIPGFHKNFIMWTLKEKDLKMQFSNRNINIWFPSEHNLYEKAEVITAREGSVILWSNLIPAGSKPNESQNNRYFQVFKISSSPIEENRLLKRKESLEKNLSDNLKNVSNKSFFGL